MNNKLIRVLTALWCEPWLLTPTMHRRLSDIAAKHATSDIDIELAQHAIADSMGKNPTARQYQLNGKTAIIPCDGVIGRKFSSCLSSSGVVSVDVFERLVRTAANDDEVDSLMLVFDSPGGLATGVPEAAQAVRLAAQGKTVAAYVDGLCCSAAYWMASQCDVIYATESADVGSIGAYIALLDESRAAEMQGLHVEMFKSGRFKGMGYPGTSLTDEQRAMLQSHVDRLAAKFKATVRSGRAGHSIPDDVMQGQSLCADDALAAGLVDEITDFDSAVRDVSKLVQSRGNKR